MAFLNKCECCGYKFKRGDGAICPECLTSREGSIDCDSLPSDLHSHIEDVSFDDYGKSDIQKQLEQERREAQQEKIARSTASASLSGKTGNRQTNFGSSSVGINKGTAFSSSNSKNTTIYTTNYSSQNAKPFKNYTSFGNSQNKNNSSSKLVKIILIFVIVSFLVSFIIPVIFAVIGFNMAKDQEEKDYTNNYVSTYEIDIPEIDIPVLPDVELPKFPVINFPEVPEIPYFSQYNTGTNYYTGMAIIAQGEKIIADHYDIEIGKPDFVPYTASSYYYDYAEYTDYDKPEECYVVEVPFVVTNNSGERLELCDFPVYLDCLYIDDEGNVSEEYFSYPLPIEDCKDSIIEDGVTYSFKFYYAVPVSHYLSVALNAQYQGDPDYTFFMDFTAEDVFKD